MHIYTYTISVHLGYKTKNIEFVSKQNYFTFVSFVLFASICKHQQQSRVPDKINIVHNENGHILVYLQLLLTVLKWGNFCNFSFDMINILRSFFYISYSKTLTILLHPVKFPAEFVPK